MRVAEAPALHAETRRAEISDLFVEPALRRRGVGRALVESATRWARSRGARRLQVHVSSKNPLGQAFWRDQGYGDHMDVLQRRL